MFAGANGSGREFKRLKQVYNNYLKTYRQLNNGSDVGATPFSEFFMLMTYVNRYSDPRTIASLGYK